MSYMTVESRLAAGKLKSGDIELDRETRRVWRAGHPVHLGPIEFRILELLLREPGRAYTRGEIVAAVWGPGAIVDERNVDAQIARLRKALVRHAIRTVRGYGYSFNEVPPGATPL